MSNYYDMKDAKVRIASELSGRGWKIYGFKEDESDSMTDYFDPASWSGVATKNGYVLVVDNNGIDSERKITKFNPNLSLSNDDSEKIKKLEQMTTDNGCTQGEENNAKSLIENIKNKVSEDCDPWEVVDTYPKYMGNREVNKTCNWHIQDIEGRIYDKGNGIIKYADIPEAYEYDINKMEYTERYKKVWTGDYEDGTRIMTDRILSEEKKKIISDFKSFILKIERVANNMNSCGDGTKETADQFVEQTKPLEKVIITKTKMEVKPVEIDRKLPIIGDILKLYGYSCYWIVTAIWQNSKNENCYDYENLGSAKRGYQKVKNAKRYYVREFNLLRDIEANRTKIYELKEVETEYEEEKYVDTNKKTRLTKENKKSDSKNEKIDVTESTIDNSNFENEKINTETDPYNDADLLEEGYIYSCHFKEWDLDMKDIISYVKVLAGIKNYIDMGCKIGFENLTYEQALEVKNISDMNKSIFFIDAKIPVKKIQESPKATQQESNIIINLNEDNNGIEITFPCKPSAEVRQQLKDHGFRWHNKLGYWYAKQSPERLEFAQALQGENKIKNTEFTINSEGCSEQGEIEKQQHNNKLIEKINNNIESLKTKIKSLKGDYKVNTWKRQNEQAGRDRKINSYEIDIKLLEYVSEKLINNEPITSLEENLIISSFRTEIHQHYIMKYGKYPQDPKIPQINHSWDKNSQYNLEIPKRQARLKKARIANNSDLLNAVEEYKKIYDNIDRYIDPVEQKINKLTNEYKMNQRGDIHFTDNKKLLEQLIELADIQKDDIILEPSAGIGSITDELKKHTSINNIEVCEYMNSYSELLKLKGYNVIKNDFLKLDKYNYYDKIVANVPFSVEQEHIQHIYKMLKPNGKAVIITSSHYTFANDKKSIEFRNWLNELTHEIMDVPEKSFSHTNVNCRILVIDKDVNNSQIAM